MIRRILIGILFMVGVCLLLVLYTNVRPTTLLSTATQGLGQRVGQRVVLEGIVTVTKCPQVQGVDVWGLEDYRGQRVRVSGVLREEVVTQAEKDAMNSAMIANRGVGTFYSLDDMKFELLK